MKIITALASLAILAAMAAGDDRGASAGEPPSPPAPERLSQTGLYSDMEHLVVDPRHRPYSPQYPLWTDGAVKARWISLPEGTRIDITDVNAWRYPVGTKLWKEFSFGGDRVETRMLWHATQSGWVFASYVWNGEQTDALLAPESGIPDHVAVAPRKRHAIPSVTDCMSCHDTGRSVVLGFGALQLSDDRDPLAPHAEPLTPEMITLRTLLEEDLLEPARRELIENPPRIRAGSPRERAALGYLNANCGNCHNAQGPLARLGLVLAHDAVAEPGAVEAAIASALDTPGRFIVPGTAEGMSRLLAPGDPNRSAIAYRMRSRRPSSQMPPLGTVIADQEAVRLIEAWITEDFTLAEPRRSANAASANGGL